MTSTPSDNDFIPYKEPLLSDLMEDMYHFFEVELPPLLAERGIDPDEVHIELSPRTWPTTEPDLTEPNF